MAFERGHCNTIERCMKPELSIMPGRQFGHGPPPLPSPLLDHPILPNAVLVKPKGISESGSIQQILDSVLRQEAAFREEHARLRGLLQQQHAAIAEKVESMQSGQSENKVYSPCSHSPVFKAEVPNGRERAMTFDTDKSAETTASQEARDKYTEAEAIKLAKSLARAHVDRNLAMASTETAIIEAAAAATTDDHSLTGRIRKFVTGNAFDGVMGFVILLNMATTAAQLQWQGYSHAYSLGMRTDDASWGDVKIVFDALDIVFNLLYLTELVARLFVFGCSFCRSYFNLLDVLIVVSTCSDTFIITPIMGEDGVVNLSALRIMRFFRVFRMGRLSQLLHTMEHLREMRILIQTLIVSVRGLMWSVILILGICLASSIVMTQLSNAFIFDENITFERRQWMYKTFGTTARSSYTIFCCTFTGTWTQISDPYIEEVGAGFALFFVPFVVFVNFAVMRVVAALFLKQTMRVADLELAQEETLRMQEKESTASELAKIFEEADTSKNGAISREEFITMLSNVKVVECLSHLDISIDEAVALFGVLCADDGEADYEEFLNGALKMNGMAKTVDTLQILHHVLDMHRLLQKGRHER